MAQKSKAHIIVEQEVKIARRVIEKYSIAPPVNIETFIGEFARIERVQLPASVDAVFLYLSQGSGQPCIILNAALPYTRQRFTLAHEAGHYFIPWHTGSYVCHTEFDSGVENNYWNNESEANRFASELLMPLRWIHSLLLQTKSIQGTIDELCETGVSAVAACIAICRALKPGYFFVYFGSDHIVRYSAKSPDTVVSIPHRGDIFSIEQYTKSCTDHMLATKKGSSIFWCYYRSDVKMPSLDLGLDSRKMLAGFIDKLPLSDSEKTILRNRINGIIGAYNSNAKSTNGNNLYGGLIQRFASKDDMSFLLDYDEFKEFLAKKSVELRGSSFY